jgi:hypothetical protein
MADNTHLMRVKRGCLGEPKRPRLAPPPCTKQKQCAYTRAHAYIHRTHTPHTRMYACTHLDWNFMRSNSAASLAASARATTFTSWAFMRSSSSAMVVSVVRRTSVVSRCTCAGDDPQEKGRTCVSRQRDRRQRVPVTHAHATVKLF